MINGILTDWQEESNAYKGKTYLQMDRCTDERTDRRKNSGTDKIDRLYEKLTVKCSNRLTDGETGRCVKGILAIDKKDLPEV